MAVAMLKFNTSTLSGNGIIAAAAVFRPRYHIHLTLRGHLGAAF
jgi:hypothetical protein